MLLFFYFLLAAVFSIFYFLTKQKQKQKQQEMILDVHIMLGESLTGSSPRSSHVFMIILVSLRSDEAS